MVVVCVCVDDANEPLPVPAEAVTFFRLIGDQLDHALDDANNDVRTLVRMKQTCHYCIYMCVDQRVCARA